MTENSKISNFYDLNAWKEGHGLVLSIYKITKDFPRDELFGLVSQMRRAAVSVTSNIAEGFSRRSLKEKVQFYSMASGSLTELHNQLMVAKDVGYITEVNFEIIQSQVVKTHMILNGLIGKTKEFINHDRISSFELRDSSFDV